jgi:hypothetical protein
MKMEAMNISRFDFEFNYHSVTRKKIAISMWIRLLLVYLPDDVGHIDSKSSHTFTVTCSR